MALKKVGYYISKGRCLRVYLMKKRNRSGKMVNKRVNSKGKSLKKGTRVFKNKSSCKKALKKMMKRKSPKRTRRSPKRTRKSPKRRSRFGKEFYGVPYFGQMVPRVGEYVSGTHNTRLSSSNWRWPKASDIQNLQGYYTKY